MKRSQFLLLGTIFVTLALNTACSKKKDSHNPHKGYVNYGELNNFDIIDGVQLTDNQKKIAEKVKKGKDIEFELLTKEMVAMHYREAKSQGEMKDISENNTQTSFQMIASSVKGLKTLNQDNMGEFKTKYEAKLEEIHKKPLVYNMEMTNINDIFNVGKMQCYSGTYLNQVTLRNHVSHVNKFDNLNPVVIYESGHVLPGFIKRDKQNDWELVGIETTVGGKGKKIYGKVKDLDRALRIVLAHDFALSEIFKGLVKTEYDLNGKMTATSCMSKVDAEMVNRAASRFSIPIDRLEQNIRVKEGCGRAGVGGSATRSAGLNASSMGFGVANTPPGDITRPTLDEIGGTLAVATGPEIFNQATVTQLKTTSFGAGQCVGDLEDNLEVSILDPRACAMEARGNEKYYEYVEDRQQWALFPPVKIDINRLKGIKNINPRKFSVIKDLSEVLQKTCSEAYADSELEIFPLLLEGDESGKSSWLYTLPQERKMPDSSYFLNGLHINNIALYSMFGALPEQTSVFIYDMYSDGPNNIFFRLNAFGEYLKSKAKDLGLNKENYLHIMDDVRLHGLNSATLQIQLDNITEKLPIYALCGGITKSSTAVTVREEKRKDYEN